MTQTKHDKRSIELSKSKTEEFYVKVRETQFGACEIIDSFYDRFEAENLREKIANGSGGLFGLYYEVWVDTEPTCKEEECS